MIEPLVAPAATETEGAQPLRHSLVFDRITFEDGKLWKPRYPSLVRYHLGMSGLQVEPGIRISTEDPMEIEITFEIEASQGVTFVREGEGVKCRAVSNPLDSKIPGLVESRWKNETCCTLVWNPSAANDHVRQQSQGSESRQKVVALRLFCQSEHPPAEYPPADEWEKAVTAVEGGLYLAIVYNPGEVRRAGTGDPSRPDFGKELKKTPKKPRIRILDIDSQLRPVYDLFHFIPQGFPPQIELEPTFRVRAGQTVELDLKLDHSHLHGLRWKASPDKSAEAALTPFSPEAQPPQLESCKILSGGKTCRVRWVREEGRRNGSVSSFLFNVDGSFLGLKKLGKKFSLVDNKETARALARMAIDPTVIEPPTCTPDNVCIPTGGGNGGRTQRQPTDRRLRGNQARNGGKRTRAGGTTPGH